MISSFIVEEHHEAFFAWSLMFAKDDAGRMHRTLLHIDAHADMEKPRPAEPLPPPDCDASELLRYTRSQLSIDDFILAGVYQGFFDQVCWMRRTDAESPPDTMLHLASEHGAGQRFFLCTSRLESGLLDPQRHKSAMLSHATPEHPPVCAAPMLLDIDLDYFHSEDDKANTLEIEITEREFHAFQTQRYHKLRMSRRNICAVERGGSYYYIVNKPDPPIEVPVDRNRIRWRIDQLRDCLAQLPVPVGITICRSRYSGYTPLEHCLWIESTLIEALQSLYPVRMQYISDYAS